MKRDLDNDLNLGRMILSGRRSLFVILDNDRISMPRAKSPPTVYMYII